MLLSSYCVFIEYSIVSILSSIPCVLYLPLSETVIQLKVLGS